MKNSVYSILLLCVVFLIFSCENRSQNSIKIGVVLPLTGNLSALGESAKTGLILAEEYINSNTYNNTKVQFIYEDGQGNPTKSINALNKLIMYDKTNIIFSIISSVDLSIVPIQKDKKFLMFSHSSHPHLSNVDPLLYRHSQTVEQEIDIIMHRIDTASFAICYMLDDYGVAFNDLLQNSTIKHQIKSSISFLPNESNFTTIVKKVIDSSPEKIVICAGGTNISNLITKLKEQNYQGEIITTLAFSVSGANKIIKDVPNVTMVDFKKLELDPEFAKFISDFEKKHNKIIGTSELMFFNSAWLVYNNSNIAATPISISNEISKSDSVNILGNKIIIKKTNDILPELMLNEQ